MFSFSIIERHSLDGCEIDFRFCGNLGSFAWLMAQMQGWMYFDKVMVAAYVLILEVMELNITKFPGVHGGLVSGHPWTSCKTWCNSAKFIYRSLSLCRVFRKSKIFPG